MASATPLKIGSTNQPQQFAASDTVPLGNVQYPQGYIDGLQLVWNSGTSISVTSGTAYIPSLGTVLVSNSTLTLSGLSLTASTLYHVYLYSNAGTPAIECVTTAPVSYNGNACQKTGANSRRYLGSVYNMASGGIAVFQHNAECGIIDFLAQSAGSPFRVLNGGSATTSTSVSLSAFIPAGPATHARMRIYNSATGSQAYFTNSLAGACSSTNYIVTTRATQEGNAEIPLNSSCAFLYMNLVNSGSPSVIVDTMGYRFTR